MRLDPFFFDRRYGLFVVTVTFLVSIGVANLRRGVIGRRLLATRSNERGAAALGINVAGSKLYAFTLGSGSRRSVVSCSPSTSPR